MSRGGPSISHLFFPDDILLLCKATNAQVNLVTETLHDFCKASGLKVNYSKSRAMCSRHVPRIRKEELARISSINIVNDLGTYLGFPLVIGRVTKNTYDIIVEKIQRRLASWKGKLLNRAGKLCLAQSVITAILVYSMQTHSFLLVFALRLIPSPGISFGPKVVKQEAST